MQHFCFLIKTYSGDLDRVLVLLESIKEHNKEAIDVVMSVPESEYELFQNATAPFSVTLLTDESICTELFTEKTNGFEPGYLNQQIIKLAFWETGLYQFYLCLDSDCSFIRDFYIKDFFFDENTPYANLYEWEQHFADRDYRRWIGIYKRNLELISTEINLDISKIISCCGCSIFSSQVLESFKQECLKSKQYDYRDILKICPFEFSWYNLWLIKSNLIRIVPVSGFFKVFHYRKQYNEMRKKLVTQDQLAEMYVGIVLNSNWKPYKAPYHYNNPHLGHKISYATRRFSSKLIGSIYKRLAK